MHPVEPRSGVERHHDQSLARLAEHQNPSAPDRWLSREEKLKLFLAFKSPWYLLPICLIALYTGLRRGNVVDLYWREIDFERRTITKTRTKSNDNLVVPLIKTVMAVLEQLPRTEERVFPGVSKDAVSTLFIKAHKSTGIEDFKLHDLRHTFGSYVFLQTKDLRTVQELLGHRDIKSTLIYTHVLTEQKQAAVRDLG
jgi:integrase